MTAKQGPAFSYHQAVSYDRLRMESYRLDWTVRPGVQKIYPGRLRLELERNIDFPPVSLPAVLGLEQGVPARPLLGPKALSRILFSAYGATAKATQPGGEFFFRTVPSAGALYPAELYLLLDPGRAGECGLEPGLYHYPSPEHGLTLLRPGEFGTGGTAFFLTAIPFRSAWKYRDRAWRYCCLDTGHVAENLLLALRAEGFAARHALVPGASRVEAFLGVDPEREGALLAVGLEDLAALPPAHDPDLASPSRVSPGERRYPKLERIRTGPEETDGSPGAFRTDMGLAPGPWNPLPPAPGGWAGESLGRCLTLRRSKRNFIRAATTRVHLAGLARMMELAPDSPLRVGLLCGGVEDLEDGFYLLDPGAQNLALVKPGDLRAEMARACLDQAWLSQAGLHFLFLADLDELDRQGGAAAYREALVPAGRLGQRIYLGAAGAGLGCCGVGAFYDEECRELLGLNHSSRLLYLVAAGPVKK